MTKANAYLRLAKDDRARFRPESEFNAGRICSVTVVAVPCRTVADVRAQAAHVRALRAQAFKPRVVSAPVFDPHPPAPPPVLPADVKRRGTPTFSALAEQPSAVPARITVRHAEDDGNRFRPECEFNAGRICSVTVVAVPCPTVADVRAQAAHVRALRAQAFKPRVVSAPVFEPHPIKLQAPSPTPVLPADAESRGAPPFSALAELPAAVPGRITVRRVLEVAADHFNTTLGDLISHRRSQPLCRRRQVAMYVAHKVTGRSLPFLGRKIGGRDHTTILHGVRVVKGLLEAGDAETTAAVNQIIERLQVTGGAHE